MRLLRSKKRDNSHVRKFHVISTFVLLNYYHLSLSPHFLKSWHRDISCCIVSHPCLSRCTDLFQHDFLFWVFSLLMTYLRWPVKALIHPPIVLWVFTCFPSCRYLFITDLQQTANISYNHYSNGWYFMAWLTFQTVLWYSFILILWVFPRTLLSLSCSFSLQLWQPAFLSPFTVHVIIC